MDVLLMSLQSYYKDNKNMDKLIEIVDGNRVSLRIIDWFVTNYSKKYNIYYEVYKDSNGDLTFDNENNKLYKPFNIYYSYKSQLKSFNKNKFDPFCRKNRINFSSNNKEINTTIGQLNFFKWAIDNLVIEYIINNYNEIETDMNNCSINVKKEKKEITERKKRQELSKSASRGLNTNRRKVILCFS
jgi:hypothetical protein